MISGIFAELYAFKWWNIILRQTVVQPVWLLCTMASIDIVASMVIVASVTSMVFVANVAIIASTTIP